MTVQRQVSFWLVALVTLAFSLWFLQDILLPFLAGFVLAYFLDPVADWLERLGLPRTIAALLIIVTAVLLLILAIIMVVPLFVEEIQNLSTSLPSLVKTLVARVNELAPQSIKDVLARSGNELPASASDIAGKATGWIATVLASVWSGGMALINVLSLLVLTPIVAFYLLQDWDHIVAKVDDWLPRDHLEEIRGIARGIDTALAGFIRGQALVCLTLGIFYASGLSLAGLNFGFAIGFLSGALSFIPFVGAIIGGALAIGVACAQFWPDYVNIAIIVGIFAAGQFIEGNILSPKLVGSSIGLHPVWLMFALFAFGYMFGFTGLLLAVPLAAATGVIVRYFLGQYAKSKLYRGLNPDQDLESGGEGAAGA
jgi:predicted PurR-regulated permease PerM